MKYYFKLISLILTALFTINALANTTLNPPKNLSTPKKFVVRNQTAFSSRVKVKGQYSDPVSAHTTARFDWDAVLSPCKHKNPCIAKVYVYKPDTVRASILKVDIFTGKVTVLHDFNNFHVIAIGPGKVTLIQL